MTKLGDNKIQENRENVRGIGFDTPESVSASESDSDFKGEFYGEIPWFLGIGQWTPEPSEEESEQPLSLLETAALISVFDDAADQLNVLKYVIGAPVTDPLEPNFKSLALRCTRRLTPTKLFPEADEKPRLTSKIKLQRDREFMEVVFRNTSKSLTEDRIYTPVIRVVEDFQREEQEEETLIQELRQNIVYLGELKIKVEEKKRLDDLEEKDRNEFMYHLQDEMDDVKLKCQIEESFVDKWEMVRAAQNLWRLRNTENFYKDNTMKLLTKMKLERRASHDMQLFLKMCQAELEEKLEEWMSLYDSEMERKENKIINLKYERDQAEEKKEKLLKLYREKTEEMKTWINFRDIRKKKLEASLIIQSWWRGVMVRKKLGPYKPKKGKVKRDKGKKK